MATQFIDCTSLNFSYNVMGVVTISYTVVHDYFDFVVYTTINAGNQTFQGYITNASVNPMPNTDGWYETQATLVATTN
jgi:hypothetical protein